MSFIINKSNINEFIELLNKNNFIIFYYLNNCIHSMQLKFIWDYLIKNFEMNGYIAEIEYNDVKYLPDIYKIMAFPAIISYKNGVAVDEFLSKRNKKNLSEFLNKNK